MRITKHDHCSIVELSDGSPWRIWPADMADTLQWLPTTEVDVRKIDDKKLFARAHQSVRWVTSAGDQRE